MTSPTPLSDWSPDTDLGGTFAEDKLAAGQPGTEPVPE